MQTPTLPVEKHGRLTEVSEHHMIPFRGITGSLEPQTDKDIVEVLLIQIYNPHIDKDHKDFEHIHRECVRHLGNSTQETGN